MKRIVLAVIAFNLGFHLPAFAQQSNDIIIPDIPYNDHVFNGFRQFHFEMSVDDVRKINPIGQPSSFVKGVTSYSSLNSIEVFGQTFHQGFGFTDGRLDSINLYIRNKVDVTECHKTFDDVFPLLKKEYGEPIFQPVTRGPPASVLQSKLVVFITHDKTNIQLVADWVSSQGCAIYVRFTEYKGDEKR